MVAPTVKLNSGYEMPLVGFGLWKVNNDTCADTVYNAIKVGYRLFDSAYDYANEKESGQGFARAIKDGLVKREELFIVSKLWNSFHDYERVKPVAKQQLAEMGIDYFDLYYIHFPVALKYVDPAVKYPPSWTDENDKLSLSKTPLHTTWKAMEELVDEGLAKSIAVSNYSGALMIDLFRYARIMPSVLQIELHPYNVQEELVKFCQENGVAVTAYSSFGPQSFIELDLQHAKDAPPLFENEVIKKIAEKNNKTPAQVLLRWATQRGIAVIPKSNTESRLAANLDVCSFDLPEEDVKAIIALDKKLRFNNPPSYGVNQPIFS